ncbi:lysine--tRNA ligase [Candidatus Nomurabacteria bacterium]|nr:lysine--tRNA ligase [Candidatus Nomurabacteria bacterium]
MASLEELRTTRIEKLEALKAHGIDVYPESVPRDESIADLITYFDRHVASGAVRSIAGRIVAIRGQGAILFVILQDGKERFQCVFKKDVLGEDILQLFKDTIDLGDFISVTGTLFTTDRGERSLLATVWNIASKALLPLPEKWHGLTDVEDTYRKRYLDLISNKETFERFEKRSAIIRAIRKFFDEKGFMEIETPILQSQAGGAMAKTFNTHHNAYDMDMVLRISLELEHKMLMTGGYERIYEIGKNFRNEGSDPTHIQEFTMIEWYAAYVTLEENMTWTEELLKHLARDVMNKTEFKVHDKDDNEVTVDFDAPWQKVTFNDLLKVHAGIDMTTASEEIIREKAQSLGMSREEMQKTGTANVLDFIYKKTARPLLINPTFVTNYPGGLKPLAKQNTDGTARVAQLIIAGAEITNQYAELIDPLVERELLEKQAQAKEGGDEEAMSVDERFLTAMEHGMPPMTGFGMGIDRLVALLTEQDNLRDTIFFPIVRPKE